MRKMYLLQLGHLAAELLTGDGELSPVLKHIGGIASVEARYLRFKRPRNWRSAVFLEDGVGTEEIDVFSVE